MLNNYLYRQMSDLDAEAIGLGLEKESLSYLKYFTAYKNRIELRNDISRAKQDLFFTVFHESSICGCFFLRGFDAGFKVPSFGVYVISNYSRKGVASFALGCAKKVLQSNHCDKLMLKVSVDNIHAKKLYIRAGFQIDGCCPDTGNLIMHCSLDK